jgi:WD40 repeat protein
MALADDAVTLKLDGLIGFSGDVPGGLKVVRSPNLPGDREWLVYPLGSQVVVRQSGTSRGKSNLTFLTGHNDDVSCVCVSRDGRTLVTGQTAVQGVMSDVLVWDLAEACECALSGDSQGGERALKHRLRQHKSGVQAVAINCNDTFLATLGGRDDNALVIWDLDSGEAICGQPAAAESGLAMAWLRENPDRVVTCGARHLRVWVVDVSLPKLHPMDAITGALKRIMISVTIGSGDEFAYVGTTTGEVLKFSIDRDGIQGPNDPDRTRPRYREISRAKCSQGVTAIMLLINPDNGRDTIVVGGGDGSIALFSENLKPIGGKKETLMGGVTSIAASEDDADVFTASTVEGNRYRIAVKPWQADLMTTAHVGVVKDCCFAPNFSGIFVTCSAGGDIRVWNTQKRVELLRIRVPNLECNAILVSSGGDSIISGWSDGRVRAFLPETGKLKFVINDAHTKLPNDKDNNGCTALAIVPNERPSGSYVLMTGGGDGRVRAWRVTSSHQAMLFSIKDHRKPVTAIKVAPDGQTAISASADGSCLCFELDPAPGAPPLKRFSLLESNIFCDVAWHPDGTGCLTAGSNFKLTYWDGLDGENVRCVDGSHTAWMTTLDVDPEHGAYYVTGSGDSTVKVWSYDEGVATAEGVAHSKAVNAVRISPDQKCAVSVGDEGAVAVWSLVGAKPGDMAQD